MMFVTLLLTLQKAQPTNKVTEIGLGCGLSMLRDTRRSSLGPFIFTHYSTTKMPVMVNFGRNYISRERPRFQVFALSCSLAQLALHHTYKNNYF